MEWPIKFGPNSNLVRLMKSTASESGQLGFISIDKLIFSGAPRAPKARARGAPLLRKYGNPSIREILVMTSSYDRPTDRPTDRPYVRPPHHVSQSQM